VSATTTGCDQCHVSALTTGCDQSVLLDVHQALFLPTLTLPPKVKNIGKSALIRRDANFGIYVTLQRIRILALIGCLPF
jgi:hypothetical protein